MENIKKISIETIGTIIGSAIMAFGYQHFYYQINYPLEGLPELQQ